MRSSSYNQAARRFPLLAEMGLPLRKLATRLIALVLALGSQVLPAAEPEPLPLQQQLERAARQRLEEYLQRQGWPAGQVTLHSWLAAGAAHLPPCEGEVAIQPSNQSGLPWGRQLYQLSCHQPRWELNGRVELSLILPVWSAARDLPKGTPLRGDDLLLKELEVSRLHRDFTPGNQSLVGLKTRHQVRMGQLLSLAQLESPLLVQKGDTVLIRAGGEEFAVSMQGQALEGGHLGEGIKVRNLSSGREIQAWVIEQGVVETRF
ncbi:MAG: flagellar basal body P-ring formation chaperone FlgA [Aeromonadaceae bacterium]